MESSSPSSKVSPPSSSASPTANQKDNDQNISRSSSHSRSHKQTINNNKTDQSTCDTDTKNIVRLCGSSQTLCGYCQGKRAHLVKKTKNDSSKSFGLLVDSLSAADYELLLYRGWRRSGLHLYKPDNWSSCCPALSIRLEANHYQISKSQKRVLKKFNKYLELPNTTAAATTTHTNNGDGGEATSVQLMDTSTTRITDRSKEYKPQKSTTPKQPKYKRRRNSAGSTSRISLSLSQQLVQDCGILQTLQQWTYELFSASSNNSNNNAVTVDPSMCKFKLFHQDHPSKTKKKNDSTPKNDDDRLVVVYTSTCAAIAGRSKGVWNRQDLSHQLVQAFVSSMKTTTTTDAAPIKEWNYPSATIFMTDCHRHEQSGQVMVTLKVVPSSLSSSSFTVDEDGDVAMKRASFVDNDVVLMEDIDTASPAAAAKKDGNHEDDTNDDIFGKWLLEQSLDATKAHTTDKSKSKSILVPPKPPYKLTMTSVPAHISALQPEVFRLYAIYQKEIHGDPNPFVTTSLHSSTTKSSSSQQQKSSSQDSTNNGNDQQEQNHKNGMNSDSDQHSDDDDDGDGDDDDGHEDTDEDNFEDAGLVDAKHMLETEYASLYPPEKMKQIQKSYLSFYRFLVESPLPQVTTQQTHSNNNNNNNNNGSNEKEEFNHDHHDDEHHSLTPGSYHQHYRINGQLIMVGVVDVLPKGLSSVYAFYDPFVSQKLALGKYTILKEIEWTQKSTLTYYYLGYYIHSCPKMKYKADYRPSELLCPTNYEWIDATKGIDILLRNSPERHCCTLVPQVDSTSSTSPTQQGQQGQDRMDEDNNNNHVDEKTKAIHAVQLNAQVANVRLDIGATQLVTIDMLQLHAQNIIRPLLEEFVTEIGSDVYKRCIVKLA